MKKLEIMQVSRDYKVKYSLIESPLKFGFEFKADSYDAIIIEKRMKIKDFDETEFERDLEYITNLYKQYEIRFENATITETNEKNDKIAIKKQLQYEELNKKMLDLIEEVGNLAKALKDLQKNQ